MDTFDDYSKSGALKKKDPDLLPRTVADMLGLGWVEPNTPDEAGIRPTAALDLPLAAGASSALPMLRKLMSLRNVAAPESSAWTSAKLSSPLGSTPRGNMQALSQGVEPTLLDSRALGHHVNRLGPNFREKSTELFGAQLADQYPGASPEQLVRLMARESKIQQPSISTLSPQQARLSGSYGSYSPDKHAVTLSELVPDTGVTFPDLFKKGVAGHEGSHMTQEFGKNPDIWDMMLRKERIPYNGSNHAIINDAGIGYEQLIQLEKMVPGTINRDLLKNWSKYTDGEKRNFIGSIYRTFSGNAGPKGGFTGSNPYAARGLESIGHFRGPYTQELDIPIHRLARDRVASGEEVNPEWFRRFKDLSELEAGYSPAVKLKGENFDPKLYSNASPSPWGNMGLAAGAGLGMATAGIALKEQKDQLDRQRAMQKSIDKVTKYGPAY